MPDVGPSSSNSANRAVPMPLERRQSAPPARKAFAATAATANSHTVLSSAADLDAALAAATAVATNASDEFVCYGDRVCFLCEGQLLALTRKFNLTYEQMALLGLLTLCSGGMFGVAGLLIWKKGLLRKRYAALFSDAIYADDDSTICHGSDADPADHDDDEHARSLATQASGNGTIYGANMRPLLHSKVDMSERSTAETTTTSNAPGGTARPTSSKDDKTDPRKPVTFRIFEYDPQTLSIRLESVGKPVRFGAPVVVVHAATHRAIRYKPHRGAVTLSKPLKNLHFQRDVIANLASLQTSSMYKSVVLPKKKKERPQSISSLFTSRFRSLTFGGTDAASQTPPSAPLPVQPLRQTEMSRSTPMSLDIATAMRPHARRVRTRPLSEQPRTLQSRMTSSDLPQPPVSASSTASTYELYSSNNAPRAPQSERLYRRFSESCVTLAHDISDSIADSLQRQRDQREDKRRLKQLLKDLPNMSFAHSGGKYFVAHIEAVRHRSVLSDGSSCALSHPLVDDSESLLRWGAPMAIVADYNGKACGIQPRQYYKDCQLYLTTETSQATIIPLREDGDLQSMAKESTRLLAHVERRQVTLSVGTYNVWMMPRIVSAFTSVSPKKNTRARLIADVLPPCDVWVFTECFDHRARAILLDKLKAAGYFYFSPTVGHKRLKRENMRKVLNGGVVLASKYPIVTVRIKLFKEACLGADKLADKGVLYCKVLKDGLPVHIFSTHLQAWSDPPSRAMRRTQMVMIADFIKSLSGIDPVNDPVLIVGDLNVNYWLNKTDHEYDEMLSVFNASDPSVVAATRQASAVSTTTSLGDPKRARQFSFDPRLNALAADGLSTDGSLELLDFVLVSRAHRQPSTAQSWVAPLTTSTPWNWRKQPQHNLSDHFPVVSAFTFDM